MNFFLLYVSLPALLFRIMAKTPFAELNNPPFLIATTLGTATAFVLALVAGRLVGRLSFRVRIDVAHGPFPQPWAATAILIISLPPALNVFVIARQHDTWFEPASVAVLIGTFAPVITLTSVMWFIQTRSAGVSVRPK